MKNILIFTHRPEGHVVASRGVSRCFITIILLLHTLVFDIHSMQKESARRAYKTNKAPDKNPDILHGLCNPGSSCYFNAVTQCLAALDGIRYCDEKSPDFLIQFNAIVSCLRTGRPVHDILAESCFALQCAEIFENNTGQQDAQQCFSGIFNLLPAGCKNYFEFCFKSSLTCKRCSRTRHCEEISTLVPLCLPSVLREDCDATVTLKQLFEQFENPEKLTQDNTVYCDNCKIKTRTTKRLSFARTRPKCLVIQLKRFYYSQLEFTSITEPIPKKNNIPVIISSQINLGKDRYRLKAIVYHSGSLASGHYVARVQKNGQWFYCNDEWVVPKLKPTKDFSPYMLFYCLPA